MTIKLLFLAGSCRKASLNMKLAKAAKNIADELGADATFIDLADYDMPIYNGDWEDENGLPEKAKKLKQLFVDHDGFFIASPEYNSGYSPLLKNAIDWISRQESKNEKGLIAFTGKVAAISAASPGGLGGLRGLVQLRMLLGNINTHVVPAQAALSSAMNSFDDAGNITDERQLKMVKNVVTQLVQTTKAVKA